MGGKIILIPESAHQCADFPVAGMLKKGTQWQCNDCNKIWVVVTGAQYNEPYSAWRKLTDKNINGEDKF